MLLKVLRKKTNLLTMSLMIITISMIFLVFGYLFETNEIFLLGFATSTMVLGFGMLAAAFIAKMKTGKIPETKYDEREKLIAYKAGFTTYIITLFALCIFVFVSFSTKIPLDIPV